MVKKGKKKRTRTRRIIAKYFIDDDKKIHYRNISFLQKYITDRGKLLSRRITGVTAKQQRKLATAVKRARFLALLPVGGSRHR